jgi:2'-5' RNA ligase
VRLFVAAYPPAHACAHLAAAVETLAVGRAAAAGVNARLAPQTNWHVTLAFLGDVPDERADAARAALDAALAGWRGGRPELWLGGGGRFGRGRFTVLWVGLRGEVGALTGLGTAVRRELRRSRLPSDHKPLRPHLTLARPGDRVDVVDDLAELRRYEGPRWELPELRLVRSHLGPKPAYDNLATAQIPSRPPG